VVTCSAPGRILTGQFWGYVANYTSDSYGGILTLAEGEPLMMQVSTLTTWTAMASVSWSSTLGWGGAVRRGRCHMLQLAAPCSKKGAGPGTLEYIACV
jgi:hypothetical protein